MNLCVVVDERQILPLLRRVFASAEVTFIFPTHGYSLACSLTWPKLVPNHAPGIVLHLMAYCAIAIISFSYFPATVVKKTPEFSLGN